MKKILLLLAVIPSISFAQVGDFYFINQASNLNGEAFNSKYTKQNYYSFIEYGISKKTSVGGLFNLARINSEYKSGTTQYALFGPEVFHRYKFFASGKHGFILQNSLKFPNVYKENNNLGLIPKQYDYEIRILGLYNFKERLVASIVHNSTPYFVLYELAYRRHFNIPFDEIRFGFSGAFDIGYNLEILLQDNINWNIQTQGTNPLNNTYSNFDISKDATNIARFSLLYHLNKRTALQAGYVIRLGGNNPFYDNKGIVMGVWHALR
jgi:hypothetical protein